MEGTSFNFGMVEEGDVVAKKVTLKNLGSDTLFISNVTTTCGCTVVKPTVTQILPHDSASLTINFNSHGLDGPVRKEIAIHSNDSTQEGLAIVFFAEIVSPIESEPRYLNFGVVYVDSTITKKVVLRNTKDSLIHLYSITIKDPQFLSYLKDNRLESLGETSIIVTMKPRTEGKFLGQIEIVTDNPRQRLLKISYIAYVRK